MNKKQSKEKRLKASRHKLFCKWLKGGYVKELKDSPLRLSRKQLKIISDRSIARIMNFDISKPMGFIEL